MPRSSSLASVHLDVGEEPREDPRQEPDAPFRILVAGNFSGGASRIRKPVLIDRDSFEEVLSLYGPEIRLEFAKAPIPVRFRELEDFHPDSLFERLPPFQALRDMRQQLEEGIVIPAEPEVSNLSGADLLASLMGEAPRSPSAAPVRSAWDAMLHELVAPYAEPKPDRRLPAMIAQTDRAITGEMRGVLHHKAFQDLEALWRGLFFLIRRLETSQDLKVYVWDMPQAELSSPEGLAALRRVAVEETVGTTGGDPWSVIAGLYYFGNEHEATLAQIAAIARAAGAPFLSGVAPDVVGLTRVFQTLRRSSDARWVGLAMPRFLLRLPYGEKTDSTETFGFEEMPDPPEHERYLWGNPAIACTYLLGEAFTRYGWGMRPGQVNQIDGLPAHVYRKDGEPELKPCAEVLLTQGSAEILLDLGLMPLLSMKGSDRVRLARFQSIAEPHAPLSGRWTS
jgi:type VI secretion system protein ImpC